MIITMKGKEIVVCHKCGKKMEIGLFPFCPHDPTSTPAIIGDECDVLIRHGICNPDGTPKRYRSKSDMKKAAFEAGWTQGFDTPKPNQRLEEKRAIEKELREKR